jgi:hypothetical protein
MVDSIREMLSTHPGQTGMPCGPQPVGRAGGRGTAPHPGSGGLASRLETAAPRDPVLQNLRSSPDDDGHDSDDHGPVRLPILARRLMPPFGTERHSAPLYSCGHLSHCGKAAYPFGRLRKTADRARAAPSWRLMALRRPRVKGERRVAARQTERQPRRPRRTSANYQLLPASASYCQILARTCRKFQLRAATLSSCMITQSNHHNLATGPRPACRRARTTYRQEPKR